MGDIIHNRNGSGLAVLLTKRTAYTSGAAAVSDSFGSLP